MTPVRVELCPSRGKSTGPEAKGKGASCPVVHPSNSQAFLWGTRTGYHDHLIGPLLQMLCMHFSNDSSQQNAKFVLEETAFLVKLQNNLGHTETWGPKEIKGILRVIHFSIFLVVQLFLKRLIGTYQPSEISTAYWEFVSEIIHMYFPMLNR